MPLRRLLSSFGRVLSPRYSTTEDVAMTDATTSAASSPPPFRSVTGPTLLGKRRHEEPSRHVSQPTVGTLSTTPGTSAANIPSSLGSPFDPSSFPTPPLKRPNFTINIASDNVPGAWTSSHSPEPASPAPTEIALDFLDAELTPEERIERLQAEGIKVRDFAYEPMPNSRKAPEVFDPIPSLIAADWHMRNPDKNHGLLSSKALFRLIKIGWLTLDDVRRWFNPAEYVALARYNDRPDERRYPFVLPRDDTLPTPSERVRLRRKAGLCTHPEDLPDSEFFGYNPSGSSDDEGPVPGPPLHVAGVEPASAPTHAEGEAASAEVTEEGVEEPKAKRPKVRKPRGRGRAKPLRRKYSRPEV